MPQFSRPGGVVSLSLERMLDLGVDARIAELGEIRLLGRVRMERLAAEEELDEGGGGGIVREEGGEADLGARARVRHRGEVLGEAGHDLHRRVVAETVEKLGEVTCDVGGWGQAGSIAPGPHGDLHASRMGAFDELPRFAQVRLGPGAVTARIEGVRTVGPVTGKLGGKIWHVGNACPAPEPSLIVSS